MFIGTHHANIGVSLSSEMKERDERNTKIKTKPIWAQEIDTLSYFQYLMKEKNLNW